MVIPVSVSGSTFTALARLPFGNGQQVAINSRIPNQTPAPLVECDSTGAPVFYYLVNATGEAFQVSATLGGEPITLTSAGIGQQSVSEWPPLTWQQLIALPLVQSVDFRGLVSNPEAPLNLNAAPNAALGLTLSGNTFNSVIDLNIQDWTAVQISSSGTLPTPLVAGATYYTLNTNSTSFQIASVIGGSAITLTGGTGQLSFQNVTLDVVIAEKLILALGTDLHDDLLIMVNNHMKRVSRSWWAWYAPSTQPGDIWLYPTITRAQIVLDCLRNPETLIRSALLYAMYLMCIDGRWRNQVKDQSFFVQFDQISEDKRKANAEKSLNKQAQLLLVSGYQGAHRIFDFGETTQTISVSLI